MVRAVTVVSEQVESNSVHVWHTSEAHHHLRRLNHHNVLATMQSMIATSAG